MTSTTKRQSVKSAPTGTRTTVGKGKAPARAAQQRAKVDANAAKLQQINDRKAAEDAKIADAAARLAKGGTPAENKVERMTAATAEAKALREWQRGGEKGDRPSTVNLDAVTVGTPATSKSSSTSSRSSKPRSERIALQFYIDDVPVVAAHNRLSGIARASGRNKGKQLSAVELRTLLQSKGIADPDNSVWSFTLPNGVVLMTLTAEDAAKRPAPVKAAKAKRTSKAPAVAKVVAKAATQTAKQMGTKAAASKSLAQRRAGVSVDRAKVAAAAKVVDKSSRSRKAS